MTYQINPLQTLADPGHDLPIIPLQTLADPGHDLPDYPSPDIG